MSIGDGRTLLDPAEATTNWVAQGTVTVNLDPDTFVQGAGSISGTADATTGTEGLLYNYGSAQDLTDQIIYLWVNIANPGLMEVKASGGIKVRATGATQTDYVERYFEGSDTYSGGWKMFVIDMNDVVQNRDAEGGTPPAVSAIQRVGIVVDLITGAMPKMQDNLFLDAIYQLDKANPGIRVEGDNGGLPWTWQDIVDAGDIFDTTKAWGHIQQDQGNIILFSAIEFGDPSTDEESTTFIDTSGANVKFGQGSNPLPDDLYRITVVGNNEGTTVIQFGSVVGTGDDRQGIGGTFWGTGGPLYTFDAETGITEIDECSIYGGGFTDAGIVQFDQSALTDPVGGVQCIGSVFTTCGEVQPNSADFLNNTIIDPADRGVEMLVAHQMKNLTFVAGTDDGEVTDFGTPTAHADATPASPHTFTHTVASGEEDVALLLMIGVDFGSAADEVEAVSYNGVPMRRIGRNQESTAFFGWAEAWILYDPVEDTAATISIRTSATAADIGADAINLRNVCRFDQIKSAGTDSPFSFGPANTGLTIENSVSTFFKECLITDDSTNGTNMIYAGQGSLVRDEAIGSMSYSSVEIRQQKGDHPAGLLFNSQSAFTQFGVTIRSKNLEHMVHHPNIRDEDTISYENMRFFGSVASDIHPKFQVEWSFEEAFTEPPPFFTISSVGTTDVIEAEYEGTADFAGTLTVENNKTVIFDEMRDNSEVRVYDNATGAELAGIEDATDGSVDDRSFTVQLAAGTLVDYVIHNWQPNVPVYETIRRNAFTWPSIDQTIIIAQRLDRNAQSG